MLDESGTLDQIQDKYFRKIYLKELVKCNSQVSRYLDILSHNLKSYSESCLQVMLSSPALDYHRHFCHLLVY